MVTFPSPFPEKLITSKVISKFCNHLGKGYHSIGSSALSTSGFYKERSGEKRESVGISTAIAGEERAVRKDAGRKRGANFPKRGWAEASAFEGDSSHKPR